MSRWQYKRLLNLSSEVEEVDRRRESELVDKFSKCAVLVHLRMTLQQTPPGLEDLRDFSSDRCCRRLKPLLLLRLLRKDIRVVIKRLR